MDAGWSRAWTWQGWQVSSRFRPVGRGVSGKRAGRRHAAARERHDQHGPAEIAGYLAHHLKLAGRADTLVSDAASALIHTTAPGLPRAVNNLAIQALVAAYADGKAIVDESAARAAVTEVTAE